MKKLKKFKDDLSKVDSKKFIKKKSVKKKTLGKDYSKKPQNFRAYLEEEE